MKKAFLCVGLLLCLLLASCQSDSGGKWYDFSLSEYITLGEYKALPYAPVLPAAVTEEQIEQSIRDVLEAHSSSETVTEGVYQAGDEIKMDFSAAFEGEVKRSSQGYTTAIGAEGFFADFEGGLSSLVGLPVGEQHRLQLTYKADHADPDWAGKTLEFTLTVHSVTRYHTAVLDDAFVQSLGGTEQTVEQYRASVRESLEARAADEAHKAELRSVWSAVLANAKVELYPQREVNGYVEHFRTLYEKQAGELGMDPNDFMMLYYGVDEDSLLTDAKGMVKQDLVLYAVCQKEGITLSSEEYARFAEDLRIENALDTTEELERVLTREYVEKAALLAKLQESLLSWALPQEPAVSTPPVSSAPPASTLAPASSVPTSTAPSASVA